MNVITAVNRITMMIIIPKYKLEGSDGSIPKAIKLRRVPIQRSIANPWMSSLRNLIQRGIFLGGVSLLSPCKRLSSSAFCSVRPLSKSVWKRTLSFSNEI